MLKQKQSYGIRVRFFKLKDSDQVSRLLTTLSRTPAVKAKILRPRPRLQPSRPKPGFQKMNKQPPREPESENWPQHTL